MTVRHVRFEIPCLGHSWHEVADLDDADPLIAALLAASRLTVVPGTPGPAQSYHPTAVIYNATTPDVTGLAAGTVWVSPAGFALLEGGAWAPLAGGGGAGAQGPTGPKGDPGTPGAQGPAGSDATITDATMAAAYGSATGAKVAADPLLKAGFVTPGAPITMTGTPGVHPDLTDATNRLTIPSYQTGGSNFGEGVRLQLMKPYAKNMIAWQIPQPASGDLETYFAMNQGFEPYDVTGTVPVGTAGWATTGGCSLAVDTSRKVLGTQSGRITWAAGAAGSQAISQPVTGLQVGNVYTLTAWLRAGAGNPPVYLDVDGATPSATIAADGDWHEVSTTWTATTTSHTVRVVLGGTATAGQATNVDLIYVTPQMGSPKSVVWIGAHYEAQDGNGMHGHWSLEVPDSGGSLRTRLEVKFVDSTGKIGVDKTLIQSSSADVVVDCSNSQRLRLRTGAGADKYLELANDEWGTSPRWRVGSPGSAETGSNAGSDFAIQRFNDTGTAVDLPLQVTRSNGKVTFGGAAGTAAGVVVNRNSAGVAVSVNTNYSTATGAIAHDFGAYDATSRFVQSHIATDTNYRVVMFADGKIEWGAGAAGRDTNLYRKAAGVLATDYTFTSGRFATTGRPAASAVGAGAMYFDTTLNKPGWSDGTSWRDASGTVI